MSFILREKINHGSFGPLDDETQARDERVGPYATTAMDHVVLGVVVNDGVAIERSIQLGNCPSKTYLIARFFVVSLRLLKVSWKPKPHR